MKEANETVLVTGGSGFLGSSLIHALSEKGFNRIRCLARSEEAADKLRRMRQRLPGVELEIVRGNLIRRQDADRAVNDISFIFHCAAGKGGPAASMVLNTIVATRNLLEAASGNRRLKRFVHVSSFAVYGTAALKRNHVINESTVLETNLKERNDGYAYVKLKQELLVRKYGETVPFPFVILRPGVVYGPAGDEISRRVGIRLFGVFLNIGGANPLPLSYVDNCAEAIVLAATVPGIEGESINIHDCELRTCNDFLQGYRRNVGHMKCIRVPYVLFWLFSWMVEAYARSSKEQIPAVFNRYKTAATWKKNQFDNSKLREVLGWKQTISTAQGLERHYAYFRAMHSGSNGRDGGTS